MSRILKKKKKNDISYICITHLHILTLICYDINEGKNIVISNIFYNFHYAVVQFISKISYIIINIIYSVNIKIQFNKR